MLGVTFHKGIAKQSKYIINLKSKYIINLKSKYIINFCIDVTFEMRTVLSGIHLFNDNSKSSDSIFISNGDGGKRAG